MLADEFGPLFSWVINQHICELPLTAPALVHSLSESNFRYSLKEPPHIATLVRKFHKVGHLARLRRAEDFLVLHYRTL